MTGPWLVLLGRGRGDADVDDTPYVARGHGREETFQRNIADWTAVQAEVARIAGLLAADLASEPRPAVRVVVKVRYAPFITETHGVTLASPSSEAGVVAEAAAEALGRFTGRRPVRLLGVRAEFESGGARLHRPDHADFREVRLGWQRLALTGEREATALVEREGALIALSQPEVHKCGTPDLGPADDRVHERLADAQATRLRPHPQRDEFHGARLLLGGADESGRLGFVDFGDIGKERSSPGDPASPIRFDRCGLPGVGRSEGARRVPQSG
jgi:hypothetical protein